MIGIETLTQKVKVRPPPEWVTVREVDTTFAPKQLGHQTIFLSDAQYQAELRQHYHRRVQRIETLEAAQKSAQFQFDFDPGTEELAIHSVCVMRGDERIEQADLARCEFFRRDQSLDISGKGTLVLLLEDIRVGDVIDSSFTTTTIPKLLPERFQLFEPIPLGVPIGVWQLEVRFAKARPMRWKSSSRELAPRVEDMGQEIRWSWRRDQLLDALPEANLPEWFIGGAWIQVTDCQSWATVIEDCLREWPFNGAIPQIDDLAQGLKTQARTQEQTVDNAIKFVQDSFRYVSGKARFGSQVPSGPAEVLRRRYGDCKDLCYLLTVLLRALGIKARPMLVNRQLANRVRDLLPMTAFDHAIVEYELDNERRWVDPVRKLQGGGSRNRPIADFGCGLPIDQGFSDLRPMPTQDRNEGQYRLRECFWLNTAGPWSVLEISITATGAHADALRNWFAHKPECVIAEERERFYSHFFPQIRRFGQIQRKDNRLSNEFLLVESYEIGAVLRPAGYADIGGFGHDAHLVQTVLKQPLHPDRRYPCALPYPYNIEHIIELDFPAMQSTAAPQFFKKHPLLTFNRKSRAAYGFHTITYSLQTGSDCIMPTQFDDFRSLVDELWPETVMDFTLPLGIKGRLPRQRVL